MQLKRLDLSKNFNLGDEGATCLSSCVNSVEDLKLESCWISKVGAENLAKAIAQRTSPVSYNYMFYLKLTSQSESSISK